MLESSEEEGEEGEGRTSGSKDRRPVVRGAKRKASSKGKASLKEEKGIGGKAWIRESAQDEPVNFMDPVVVKRVLGQQISISQSPFVCNSCCRGLAHV